MGRFGFVVVTTFLTEEDGVADMLSVFTFYVEKIFPSQTTSS